MIYCFTFASARLELLTLDQAAEQAGGDYADNVYKLAMGFVLLNLDSTFVLA